MQNIAPFYINVFNFGTGELAEGLVLTDENDAIDDAEGHANEYCWTATHEGVRDFKSEGLFSEDYYAAKEYDAAVDREIKERLAK